MAVKTLTGSCACDRLRYQVKLDLDAGGFRCACRRCSSLRSWFVVVPWQDFRAPEFAAGTCKRCGVRCFARSEDFVGVVLETLDDVSPDQLAAVPVEVIEGHDRFASGPTFTACL